MNYKVLKLCELVEGLSADLNLLVDDGHSRTVYCVMVRMRLAAATADLMYFDLIDRIHATHQKHDLDKLAVADKTYPL